MPNHINILWLVFVSEKSAAGVMLFYSAAIQFLVDFLSVKKKKKTYLKIFKKNNQIYFYFPAPVYFSKHSLTA